MAFRSLFPEKLSLFDRWKRASVPVASLEGRVGRFAPRKSRIRVRNRMVRYYWISANKWEPRFIIVPQGAARQPGRKGIRTSPLRDPIGFYGARGFTSMYLRGFPPDADPEGSDGAEADGDGNASVSLGGSSQPGTRLGMKKA
jgi:hypothetical protein